MFRYEIALLRVLDVGVGIGLRGREKSINDVRPKFSVGKLKSAKKKREKLYSIVSEESCDNMITYCRHLTGVCSLRDRANERQKRD